MTLQVVVSLCAAIGALYLILDRRLRPLEESVNNGLKRRARKNRRDVREIRHNLKIQFSEWEEIDEAESN